MDIKKKIAVFVFALMLFFVFSCNAFAENVSLYGSVTDSTSQVNILMGLLPNESDFKLGMQYLCCRIGENQYRIYYADSLQDSTINYIDYSRYNLGSYSYEWRISRGTTNSLVISTNNYTYVSNTQGGIYKSVESYFSDKYIVWLLPVLVALYVFSVFKPSKGVKL